MFPLTIIDMSEFEAGGPAAPPPWQLPRCLPRGAHLSALALAPADAGHSDSFTATTESDSVFPRPAGVSTLLPSQLYYVDQSHFVARVAGFLSGSFELFGWHGHLQASAKGVEAPAVDLVGWQ
jgi:hypothetical protein